MQIFRATSVKGDGVCTLIRRCECLMLTPDMLLIYLTQRFQTTYN
jgi:hypothetical protein